MTTYVALVRGINVGGRTKVAMADLRALFEALGHADVRTYLQSGNVVFTSAVAERSRLLRDVEKRLAEDLGVPAKVLLRSPGELARVVTGNPFLGRESDPTKLHVTFLAAEPDPDRADRLSRPAGEPAEYRLAGTEVYLYCPDGYGRTKLNNAYLEKRLGLAATTRNWKTVNALSELANG